MEKYIRITKYHVAIIILYLIVVPALWITVPEVFRYGYDGRHVGGVVVICLATLFALAVYSSLYQTKEIRHIYLDRTLSSIPLLVTYALFFAAAEEIIFRGVIQGYLVMELGEANAALLVASAIFGAAHLPNGAHGWSPKEWNWQFAVIAFAGGIAFGEIYLLTESLLIPTALHATILFWLIVRATRSLRPVA